MTTEQHRSGGEGHGLSRRGVLRMGVGAGLMGASVLTSTEAIAGMLRQEAAVAATAAAAPSH